MKDNRLFGVRVKGFVRHAVVGTGLPERPVHPACARVRDAANELIMLANEWDKEWQARRDDYDTICAEEKRCIIRCLQGCGINIEGYTFDCCQHRDGTRSVYEEEGRILFRCLRCGAGRDRDGRWIDLPNIALSGANGGSAE